MPVDRLRKNPESIIHHRWLFDRNVKINIKSWVRRKLAWLVLKLHFWRMVLSLYILQNTRMLVLLLNILSALCAYSVHMGAPDTSMASSVVEKAHSLLCSPLATGECFWMNSCCFQLLQSLCLSPHPARQLYLRECLHTSGKTWQLRCYRQR